MIVSFAINNMNNMIKISFLLFITFGVGFLTNAFGQTKIENQIRNLESQEKEAVIKGDTLILYKLWSPNYVTNGTMNAIITMKDMKDYYRKGHIDHSHFDRIIEKITITDKVAIVMGKENKKQENSEKTSTRRFTNIWIQTKGVWLLTARQATNMQVE
jgi:hypothetical protein